MEVYPAIDLQQGKCVRLIQGDMQRSTTYSEDPAEVARTFQSAGARWVHVVDLDATLTGFGANHAALHSILEVGLMVQTGGGVRSVEHARALLALGVSRIVVGTIAVENPQMLNQLVQECGELIAVATDVRDGKVAMHGWQVQSSLPVDDILARIIEGGVRRVIYTDISRDGMLTGPDLQGLQCIVEKFGELKVIASGGITQRGDVRALRTLGVEGIIIGKALYERTMTLTDALAAAQ